MRYEDLRRSLEDLDADETEQYFRGLLASCGIDDLPHDWRDRVRTGADRRQSGTARENLQGLEALVPEELPDQQKRLVDFAAPGLRELLGYR